MFARESPLCWPGAPPPPSAFLARLSSSPSFVSPPGCSHLYPLSFHLFLLFAPPPSFFQHSLLCLEYPWINSCPEKQSFPLNSPKPSKILSPWFWSCSVSPDQTVPATCCPCSMGGPTSRDLEIVLSLSASPVYSQTHTISKCCFQRLGLQGTLILLVFEPFYLEAVYCVLG